MLLRILSSDEEANQVLENLFLKIGKLAGEQPEYRAGLESWMFLGARTEAIQRKRKANQRPPLDIPAPGRPPASWLPTANRLAFLSSRLSLVQRVLAQLPAAQRQVLDLVLYEGLTEEEAAVALKEPPGRVRDHVRAALVFVRQRLHTLMGTWTADI